MSTQEPADQEPHGGHVEHGPEPLKTKARRKALSALRRELSEDELKTPAVQKLLLDEIERLEEDNGELIGYRDRFHERDKHAAVLEQKIQRSNAQEIISMSCVIIGGAALGYIPSVWGSQPTGYIALIFGGLLVIFGVFAKWVKS